MTRPDMRYVSLFSGIEAATVAWHPLGWEPVAFSEIEPFPRAVLAHHYPDVTLHGDMTQVDWSQYRGRADLVVGGSPCQAFSVAGLRKGLDDPRGNLTLEYLKAVDRIRPAWVVWENVPGVLSIDGGRVFGAFLGGLGQLGYGFAYRVLDAQHFGVPQRRRRVFVVGYLGDWRRAAAVLFERHSLSGHPAPRRETGEGVAPTIAARTRSGGGLGTDFDRDGGLIHCAEVAPTLNAHFGDKQGLEDQHALNGAGLFVAHALRAEGFDASEDGTGRGTPLVPVAIQERAVCDNPDAGPDGVGVRTDGLAYTLEARQVPQAVAFDTTQVTSKANRSNPKPGDPCHPLAAGAHPPAVAQSIIPLGMQVRRLTPTECVRLQGFPDDYLDIPYRGKPAADGPRYKALGNSMAVPVMRWIGARIAATAGWPGLHHNHHEEDRTNG
jgi:DNA (cytosine-5)-methyltransferase 1